jgi:hypothetical protein
VKRGSFPTGPQGQAARPSRRTRIPEWRICVADPALRGAIRDGFATACCVGQGTRFSAKEDCWRFGSINAIPNAAKSRFFICSSKDARRAANSSLTFGMRVLTVPAKQMSVDFRNARPAPHPFKDGPRPRQQPPPTRHHQNTPSQRDRPCSFARWRAWERQW